MTPGNSTSSCVTLAKAGPSSAPLKDVLLVTSSRITTAPRPSTLTFGQACSVMPISISFRCFLVAIRVATDSIYVQKTAVHKLEGRSIWGSKEVQLRGALLLRLRVRCAVPHPVAPGLWHDKGELTFLPKELAADKKGPHSQSRAVLRRSAVEVSAVIPQWRRGLQQDHASDRALPPEESSFLHSDPLTGERNADPGSPGSDLSQLPLEWPDRMDARKDWVKVRSPGDHLGRGIHGTPPHAGDLP